MGIDFDKLCIKDDEILEEVWLNFLVFQMRIGILFGITGFHGRKDAPAPTGRIRVGTSKMELAG